MTRAGFVEDHVGGWSELARSRRQAEPSRVDACSRVESAAAARRGERAQWDVWACWLAVDRVWDELGEWPTYRRYRRLAAGSDDLPPAAMLHERVGRWPEIEAVFGRFRGNGAGEDPLVTSAPDRMITPVTRRGPAAQVLANCEDLNVRVLAYLAVDPGASGVAVARWTDKGRYARVRRLLARHERAGLVVRERRGAANAWTVTECVREMLEFLAEVVYVSAY